MTNIFKNILKNNKINPKSFKNWSKCILKNKFIHRDARKFLNLISGNKRSFLISRIITIMNGVEISTFVP